MDSGWDAVLKGGGWPALVLAILAAIIKGPDMIRSISKSYRGEEAKREDRLERERDEFWSAKDRELDRLRTENATLLTRIEALLSRIAQLMASIAWWREYARDMRHERLNDRRLHEAYQQLHGVEPFVQPDIPPVPRVSEEDNADDYRGVGKSGAD